jgi:predicted RNA-binding Zn-ribbon protein involved in translation (DUF1610 family)
MTRGGKRDNAGRPSSWTSGCKFQDTKLIRVPFAIADKLLEIAHQLDAGEQLEIETESNEVGVVPVDRLQERGKVEKSPCPACGSTNPRSKGIRNNKQRYLCRNCGRSFSIPLVKTYQIL